MSNPDHNLTEESVIEPVKHWIETLVVGLDLCPFARSALLDNRVRFVVDQTQRREELLQTLTDEMRFLDNNEQVQTTLIIHPKALLDFDRYNQFLAMVEELVKMEGKEGVYQVASFHPKYQFDGTEVDDPENFTNRSPFPILHILRERDVSAAIDSFPNADQIPEKNVNKMRVLGNQRLLDLLESCFHGVDTIDASVNIFKRRWD